MTTKPHLWDIYHPYASNVTLEDMHKRSIIYPSWDEYLSTKVPLTRTMTNANADMDYNLLIRWDFFAPRYDSDGTYNPDMPIKWYGDTSTRDCVLKLYHYLQRKGYLICEITRVCRADEPSIIDYLRPRHSYLMSLWEPL